MFLKRGLIKKCATLSICDNQSICLSTIHRFIHQGKKTFREAILQKTWHMLLVLINGLLHSRANNIGMQG